jgi:hypothetical protein
MSGVGSGIKKKMVVSADQFEDAEEDETEDFLGAAAPPANKPKEPPAAVAGPNLGPSHVPFALKIAERVEKASPSPGRSPGRSEQSFIKEEVDPDRYRGGSTSPALPRTLTNPLDALASACVAKEQSDQLKVKMAEPKPPKEGTKVRAEDISCTDGKLSGNTQDQ